MSTMTGQKHWQAPDQLRITREPGWAYRYIKKADVEKRMDEGWEIVESPLKKTREGGPVDRAQHHRGLILMRMPQGMADERNAHYKNLHMRRLRAVARGAGMTAIHRARTSEGAFGEDGKPLAGAIGRGLTVRQGVNTDEGLSHSDNIDIPVTTHPDDLREDAEVARELNDSKTATEGDGETPKPDSAKKRR